MSSRAATPWAASPRPTTWRAAGRPWSRRTLLCRATRTRSRPVRSSLSDPAEAGQLVRRVDIVRCGQVATLDERESRVARQVTAGPGIARGRSAYAGPVHPSDEDGVGRG